VANSSWLTDAEFVFAGRYQEHGPRAALCAPLKRLMVTQGCREPIVREPVSFALQAREALSAEDQEYFSLRYRRGT
jgi:hypothetical protein